MFTTLQRISGCTSGKVGDADVDVDVGVSIFATDGE